MRLAGRIALAAAGAIALGAGPARAGLGFEGDYVCYPTLYTSAATVPSINHLTMHSADDLPRLTDPAADAVPTRRPDRSFTLAPGGRYLYTTFGRVGAPEGTWSVGENVVTTTLQGASMSFRAAVSARGVVHLVQSDPEPLRFDCRTRESVPPPTYPAQPIKPASRPAPALPPSPPPG